MMLEGEYERRGCMRVVMSGRWCIAVMIDVLWCVWVLSDIRVVVNLCGE